jgi:hypothetical protein
MAEAELNYSLLCKCNEPSVRKVSQSEKNPNREFWSCQNGGKDYGGCGFFKWADGPQAAQATKKRALPASVPAAYANAGFQKRQAEVQAVQPGDRATMLALMAQIKLLIQKIDVLTSANQTMEEADAPE